MLVRSYGKSLELYQSGYGMNGEGHLKSDRMEQQNAKGNGEARKMKRTMLPMMEMKASQSQRFSHDYFSPNDQKHHPAEGVTNNVNESSVMTMELVT